MYISDNLHIFFSIWKLIASLEIFELHFKIIFFSALALLILLNMIMF